MGTMQWQSGMSMCEMRLVKQSCESQMVPPRIFLASVSYQNVITVATRMHTRTHAHSARARNHTHTHSCSKCTHTHTHTHTIAVNARTRAHTHTHNHTHTPHKHARDRDKGKDRIPINIYILLQTFLRQTATTPCASLSQSDTQRELKKKTPQNNDLRKHFILKDTIRQRHRDRDM